jgi:hypothetical protein
MTTVRRNPIGSVAADLIRKRTNAKRFAMLREKVGIQFLSLRQHVLVKNSLSPYTRAKSSINTGLRTQTSGLRRTGRDAKFCLSGRFSLNLRTKWI